jgi:hypothetical protein
VDVYVFSQTIIPTIAIIKLRKAKRLSTEYRHMEGFTWLYSKGGYVMLHVESGSGGSGNRVVTALEYGGSDDDYGKRLAEVRGKVDAIRTGLAKRLYIHS